MSVSGRPEPGHPNPRVVVTGGAGFIGARLVQVLNRQGIDNILIVDDLAAEKVANLSSLDFADLMPVKAFTKDIANGALPFAPSCVFHQGACSDTMATDGEYILSNNYEYSKALLHSCLRQDVDFIYASSASVYGNGVQFAEAPINESPLNLYALSKWMFDQYVRRNVLATPTDSHALVMGMRYFNVYGPCENHKNRMASVAWHFSQQYRNNGKVKLFEGTGGYGNGEQRRDFVYVDDVVDVNLAGMNGDIRSGIYNVGTGQSSSFNDVANATINAWRVRAGDPELTTAQLVGDGLIEYIEFPEALTGKYQSFTEANIAALRAGGYRGGFRSVRDGVRAYIDYLADHSTD